MTPPRFRATWALLGEVPPLWFHVVGGGARAALDADAACGVGTGMAGTPSGGELLQGRPTGFRGLTGGRNKGCPGVFGRKKGHLRKHDLRKVCPVKGGGGGSGRRKGIFGRLPVGGKGAPRGNWLSERMKQVRAFRRLRSWDQRTDRRLGGLDRQESVNRHPFPLLQVLLGSLVPPTLPRRPQPQSPLISRWRHLGAQIRNCG